MSESNEICNFIKSLNNLCFFRFISTLWWERWSSNRSNGIHYSIKYSMILKHLNNFSRLVHFTLARARARSRTQSPKYRFNCLPLNSWTISQQQRRKQQQMNRKQSARAQNTTKPKKKLKYTFTASLNGTTHRMPSMASFCCNYYNFYKVIIE